MRFAFLIALRLWRQLTRDRRTVGLALVAPMVFVTLFGIAFGGEIEHLPIIVINHDSDANVVIETPAPFNFVIINETVPSIGNSILQSLKNTKKVDVTTSISSFDQAKTEVDNKSYRCAILIPENYTYNLASPLGENISISFYLDNSDPQVGAVVIQAFQDAFQEAAGKYRSNFGLSIEYAYGEDLSTLDYFAPAMIAFAVFFFSFILVIMNLIGERKGGTLPLLLQCPYEKGQIVIGYLLAFSLLSMVQTTVVIAFSSLFFGISFGTTISHYVSIYLGAVVIGWTGLVLAIFLSSFARSEFQAVQFVPTIILPVILLSGIIIPLDQIPIEIRWVAYLLPTTYGVRLLRTISIEGMMLDVTNFDFLVQIIFFLVFLIASRFTLKES